MPATFERTFRVRHYECDAFGHLNPVNYVRYMQEVALDASADVGWDRARYSALGYGWLARETRITYLHPVARDEHLTIKTWVEDFRRVRSWRRYEFRRVGDDKLLAKASTEWIYMHVASGKPATIPPEMIHDFHPEGSPPPGESRNKFPSAPTESDEIFTLEKRVAWADIDTEAHLNNAAYLTYLEDASTQVSRHYGWLMAQLMAAGFMLMPREFQILYLLPGYMDDALQIRTWGGVFEWATTTRYYEIVRPADEATLARAHSTWLCVDLKTGQLRQFPAEYVAAMKPNTH
ncbi:MAG: acyl-[acyl-carrier-protein] thioesterase [Aggregatilineales bacterium]